MYAICIGSVQIVFGLFGGLSTNAVVLFADQRPGPAVFHFQETVVAVSLLVSTTDRVVQHRAYPLATLELESCETSLHGHHIHVFPVEQWKIIQYWVFVLQNSRQI